MRKFTRLFIGLDDSKESIAVAVAGDHRVEVRSYGVIANTPQALRRLVRRLGRPKDLYFAYEAGPGGYGMYRELQSLGAQCIVAAPTRTPRRSGDRIKNDQRDADTLARLHRAGELTPVWVPDAETEAMRDLTRAREDSKYAQTKARQRLQSFLLRHGRRYPGRSSWTKQHMCWLCEQRFAHPCQQTSFEEYTAAVEETTARVQRLEEQVHQLVREWSRAPVVRALTAHRGVSTLTAATVVAELGDLTRFDRAPDIMGFVGLVPSLHASGGRYRSGAITKTGNGHVRRVLTEAAWAYRHPARRTAHLRRRLEGQSQEIQDLAWKTQLRLCGRYRRVRGRGMHLNKVITAIARELMGFLWATAKKVESHRADA
jgi:transposase